MNAFLAAFNLLPIPPLDGSAVVGRLLPRSMQMGWMKVQQYGMAILIVLLFVLPQVLRPVFDRAFDLWSRLL